MPHIDISHEELNTAQLIAVVGEDNAFRVITELSGAEAADLLRGVAHAIDS